MSLRRVIGKVDRVFHSQVFGEWLMDIVVDGTMVLYVKTKEPCIDDTVNYVTKEDKAGRLMFVREGR